jgi:hypothetical protein
MLKPDRTARRSTYFSKKGWFELCTLAPIALARHVMAYRKLYDRLIMKITAENNGEDKVRKRYDWHDV